MSREEGRSIMIREENKKNCVWWKKGTDNVAWRIRNGAQQNGAEQNKIGQNEVGQNRPRRNEKTERNKWKENTRKS